MTAIASHGEVHVWRVPLRLTRERLAQLERLLDAEERERAGSLRPPGAPERFIASHAILRLILGEALGAEPAQLRFGRRCGHCGGEDHGKPYLADPEADLDFNLAHSGELALVAVSEGRRVGVDVEQVRANVDVPGLSRRYFSPAERSAIDGLPAGERRAAFFRCWTRKEAYLKATGVGLAGGLDRFSVGVEPGDPVALSLPGERGAAGWRLASLAPSGGYEGALAAEGSWKLRLREFSG